MSHNPPPLAPALALCGEGTHSAQRILRSIPIVKMKGERRAGLWAEPVPFNPVAHSRAPLRSIKPAAMPQPLLLNPAPAAPAKVAKTKPRPPTQDLCTLSGHCMHDACCGDHYCEGHPANGWEPEQTAATKTDTITAALGIVAISLAIVGIGAYLR